MAKAQDQNNKIRLAFRIGYLGSNFFGSQYQPDHRTVEGEIINACLRGGLFSDPRSARLNFSGRTDRGVHARRQIIAFSTYLPDRAIRALAGQLPPDIWVNGFCRVPESYSPRYDVISRTYRYIFSVPFSDSRAVEKAALLFLGTHNFTCFARIEPGKNPERSVSALTVNQENGVSWIEVTAQSYLWHMVRSIASALYDISEGTLAPDQLQILLQGKCQNKVRPACADGLILWDIADHLVFQPLPVHKRTLLLHQDATVFHYLMARVHALLISDVLE